MSKKAKFFMEKEDSRLEFCGDIQRSLYSAWVDGLPDKQIVEMTLEKRRHAKTNPQLGYWHAVLMPFAVEALESSGNYTLPDLLLDGEEIETNENTTDWYFKIKFQRYKKLKKILLKRDMTDEEMGQLIDFTMMWLAKNLSAVAPQPAEK